MHVFMGRCKSVNFERKKCSSVVVRWGRRWKAEENDQKLRI